MQLATVIHQLPLNQKKKYTGCLVAMLIFPIMHIFQRYVTFKNVQNPTAFFSLT